VQKVIILENLDRFHRLTEPAENGKDPYLGGESVAGKNPVIY
jgi:hypothetical protein